MSEIILSVDPGLSTGIALGEYSDADPLKIISTWQISGGLGGFMGWIDGDPLPPHGYDRIVAEKFVPLSGGGFSHTLKSVEPLRIEGAMVALDMIEDYTPDSPQWQRPDSQYFCGGSGKVEKRKRSKEFLKEHGMYLTGASVGQKDAEDAISAILHMIAYMRKIEHLPTMREFFPPRSRVN